MPYEILEHPADLRLRVWGRSLDALFKDALAGMNEFLGGKAKTGRIKRNVKINSSDKTALLVDFLNEALSLSQIHREAYAEVSFKKLTDTEAAAELVGSPVEEFAEDIKAATYHEANVIQNPDGVWETILVFDI